MGHVGEAKKMASPVEASKIATPQNDSLAPTMPNPHYRQQEESISVALTHDVLDPLSIMAEVKSPKAGAIVLFAGKLFNPCPTPHA